MPPKQRITREMILEAAYAIAREQGPGRINARAISGRLGCSTQPVLYYFGQMEDIRREVYRMADEAHTAFLMQCCEDEDPLMAIGLNYIRFAVQEKQLFRLLFQSDHMGGRSVAELAEAPELGPVLDVFEREAGLNAQQAKLVFKTLAMLVHGWASMLANNSMEYDEGEIVPMLETAFMGMVDAMKLEEAQL